MPMGYSSSICSNRSYICVQPSFNCNTIHAIDLWEFQTEITTL